MFQLTGMEKSMSTKKKEEAKSAATHKGLQNEALSRTKRSSAESYMGVSDRKMWFRLPNNVYAAFEAYCASTGRETTTVLTEAVTDLLAKYKMSIDPKELEYSRLSRELYLLYELLEEARLRILKFRDSQLFDDFVEEYDEYVAKSKEQKEKARAANLRRLARARIAKKESDKDKDKPKTKASPKNKK